MAYKQILTVPQKPMRGSYLNTKPPEYYFHKHYEISESTGCWNWTASCYKNGYGQASINQKVLTAHKAAYLLLVGDIPSGSVLMHSCDNRKCVNPEHLSLGTHKDNSNDCINKGRFSVGESHYNAKLTEAQIRSIRIESGTQQKIADKYGVSRSYVSQIRSKTRRKHDGIS